MPPEDNPADDEVRTQDKDQVTMDGTAAAIREAWLEIKFQLGPVKEVGVNGTTIERVVEVLINRLEGFQKGDFRCRENALAITKLQEARHWLLHRTNLRVVQGVEGKNELHKS